MHPCEEPTSVFSITFLQVLGAAVARPPPQAVSSPGWIALSSQGQCSCLTSLVLLCWGPSSLDPKLDAVSRCSFTTITSLNLLSVHLQEAAGYLLSHSTMVSTRNSRSFLAELLPSQIVPNLSCWGGLCAQVQNLTFILDELHNIPVNPLPQPLQLLLNSSSACKHTTF